MSMDASLQNMIKALTVKEVLFADQERAAIDFGRCVCVFTKHGGDWHTVGTSEQGRTGLFYEDAKKIFADRVDIAHRL
ncbi:MAG: hypothetical protein CSA26_01350 [Desulfobacterales bacterium]|nr:MAG: hypothetical protein CSA26_01350 [Desulfobacterales bacterium]